MTRPTRVLETDAKTHAVFDMDMCRIFVDAWLGTSRRHPRMTRAAIRDLGMRADATKALLLESTGPSDPIHRQAYIDQIAIEHERDHVLSCPGIVDAALRDERTLPTLDDHENVLRTMRRRNASIRMDGARFLDEYIVERTDPEAHALNVERRRRKGIRERKRNLRRQAERKAALEDAGQTRAAEMRRRPACALEKWRSSPEGRAAKECESRRVRDDPST